MPTVHTQLCCFTHNQVAGEAAKPAEAVAEAKKSEAAADEAKQQQPQQIQQQQPPAAAAVSKDSPTI